jgi:hypothetical protein
MTRAFGNIEATICDSPRIPSGKCLIAKCFFFPCFFVELVELGNLDFLGEGDERPTFPCAILGDFGRWGLFASAIVGCRRRIIFS